MHAAARRAGRSHTLLILMMAVLVSATVSVLAWYLLVRRQLAAGQEQTRQLLLGAIGLDRPVTNRLDARFTDADADLVADPPTDAKAHLDPATLTFSYVAVDDGQITESFKTAWAGFMAHLSQAAGKPVEYLVLRSERDQLLALRDGRLHVTALNTGRVPMAVNACGFVPVAMLADESGDGRTYTEVIVAAGSRARSLGDLRGNELTLTDPGSNSGFKAPLVFLKEHGLLPERDFVMRYSGSQEESIRGVAAGRYPAAAVAADVLRVAVAAGEIRPEQYRTIFKSEPFPTAGIGHVYNLKPELAAKVRDALLTHQWKGANAEPFFGGVAHPRLVPVNYKDDWSLVRRIDDAMGYRHELAEPTTAPTVE